jgi:glutaredoxin
MKTITVLGSGCAKCTKTAETIQRVAEALKVDVTVIKDSSPQLLLQYGVMQTPAVLIDEQLMHSGSIPHRSEIEQWLLAE